jgi:hypothetical protein
LTLEGFNTLTGAVTWRQVAQNVGPFLGAGNLPFLDDDHVVIEQGGHYLVLDTDSGAVAPLATGQTLWCASTPYVKVLTPSGMTGGAMRTGTNRYFGCAADGTPVPTRPASQPAVVGVVLDGKFFWPGQHSLEAEPAT